ncbi:aldo/keto reductase [Weissella soli]|uniref:2,5-diketo-D-gluconate reductase A n=1 Tax=Weissella soli TaxID=155866 RepID=A0A288QW49_9LACO|nr:aldo/keto reductase [Weissella soli]AOT56353.1 2,5-didehydrogluconate reductase (2-dehydro-L-gulonate-forming) [Weissella soli]NKY82807.1 aldo/keto reductase [Weissella soli]RDL11923.1 2,5-diketo-D-gluconate reductase A [Weissella soli]GEN92847.1 2,5-diketo-D-gluconic acid reductase [Weissella soli]
MDFTTLNNGNKMPQLGFGVFQIPVAETKQAVRDAIKAGYRSVDTARIYGNEAETGVAVNEAVAAGEVAREDIFLTTKLFIQDFDYDRARAAIDDSLQNAGQAYFDLILLHQPYGDVYGAWRALAEAQAAGQVKNIGISNFYPAKFIEFVNVVEQASLPKPQINQVEFHPFYQEKVAREWHTKYGVQMEAWGPFAEGQHGIFSHPVLLEIAKKHEVAIAQVVLKWVMQEGIVAVAKSTKPERMAQNLDIWNFTLDGEDIAKIENLDTNTPDFDHLDPNRVDWFYNVRSRG